MKPYNGHPNWSQWNVALWINNEESLYRLALEASRLRGTLHHKARSLQSWLPNRTPDGARYSLRALQKVLEDIE